MAKRKTVQERIAGIKINPNYDAVLKDFLEVSEINGFYEIFSVAFRFGYLQGTKAAKKELEVKA